eukprot:2692263-Rhodomonas_salina.1
MFSNGVQRSGTTQAKPHHHGLVARSAGAESAISLHCTGVLGDVRPPQRQQYWSSSCVRLVNSQPKRANIAMRLASTDMFGVSIVDTRIDIRASPFLGQY